MATSPPHSEMAKVRLSGRPGTSLLFTVNSMIALPKGDITGKITVIGGIGQVAITTGLAQFTLNLLTISRIQSMPTEIEDISTGVKSMHTGRTDRFIAYQSGDARIASLT